MQKPTLKERLEDVARQGQQLLLDGAMGTIIMRQHLTEEDFRGEEFAQWPVPLKGDNDLLVLTRPDLIRNIHRQYPRFPTRMSMELYCFSVTCMTRTEPLGG